MSGRVAGPVRVSARLRAATSRLAAAGVPSPAYDARALLAHVLGRPPAGFLTVDEVDAVGAADFDRLVAQRADRVPLQHLTGLAGFRRLELTVGPGVFVPRPETEVLVDWVLERLATSAAPLVVDLCSGSGALAFAIADELPAAIVHGVELDPHAFAWAQLNLERLSVPDPGLPARVRLHLGDIADALPDLDGTVDAVVANPPYIPLGAHTEPEVEQHDPPLALWGGPDGLDPMRTVLRVAARLLRPGGVVAVEHADLQGETVPALLGVPSAGAQPEMARWSEVADHTDLAGRSRYTTARYGTARYGTAGPTSGPRTAEGGSTR